MTEPMFPTQAAGPLGTGSVLTVSQLTRMLRDAIRAHMPPSVSVVGEISNWRVHSSGHVWFTLKDDKAQLTCVMWADRLRRLKFKPQDGLQVVATGRIDIYAAHGRYQLYADRLEPVGVGALELAFRQLYEKLRKEGLFDEAHKKPLPAFPRTIAIVTSPTGAAVRDMIRTILRRWPAIRLIVVPVRVQGDGAAEEISRAIAQVNRLQRRLGGVDLLIVGRGGGSIEDLWAFNEEAVARAIFASKIPIISAVGHERDTTIADLVADARAATPTHAGEMAVRVMDEILSELAGVSAALTRRIAERLENCRLRLQAMEKEPWFADPAGQIRQHWQGLDELERNLAGAVQGRLRQADRSLGALHLRMQPWRPDVQLAQWRTRLEAIAGRLHRAVDVRTRRYAEHLAAAYRALRLGSPVGGIAGSAERLASAAGRLEAAFVRHVETLRGRLDAWQGRLEASSHKRVLKRGFTITRHAATGKIITSAAQVQPGQTITTETADGRFGSTVKAEAAEHARKVQDKPPPAKPEQLMLPIDPPSPE